MKVTPVARTESLIVKEVDGETLVYDLDTDKAHCLNETAARVWKNCDGHTGVSEIAKVLSRESNAKVDDELVWLALDQLEKFQLLEEAPTKPAFLSGMTRRQMVARLGIAAVALPAIMSIVSPTAKAQGSGTTPPTGCCAGPPDCISGTCIQNPACTDFSGHGNSNSSTKACV